MITLTLKDESKITPEIQEWLDQASLAINKEFEREGFDKMMKLAAEFQNDILENLPVLEQKDGESWHEALRTRLPEINWRELTKN